MFGPSEWKDYAVFIARRAKTQKEREHAFENMIQKLEKESHKKDDLLLALLFAGQFERFLNHLISDCDGSLKHLIDTFELVALIHAKSKIKPKGPAFTHIL